MKTLTHQLHDSLKSCSGDAPAQLEVLLRAFQDDTAYIVTCGPSVLEYPAATLQSLLHDRLVLAVKHAYHLIGSIADFHVLNMCNVAEYQYPDRRPIVVEMTRGGRSWHRSDVRLPLQRVRLGQRSSIAPTFRFDDYLLERQVSRPVAPGIMNEVAIYLAVHLGVRRIVTLGWDLISPDRKQYHHFYDTLSDQPEHVMKKMDWEIPLLLTLTEQTYHWLKSRGVSLCSATRGTSLPVCIPRVSLTAAMHDNDIC